MTQPKKAWELIEQTGWCQKEEVKRKKGVVVGYCAAGAIFKVYGDDLTIFRGIINKVRAVIGAVGLAAWNDAPERTKAQVVATLKGVEV